MHFQLFLYSEWRNLSNCVIMTMNKTICMMLAKMIKIKKAFRQKNWPLDYHESPNFWYDLLKQASIAQSMYILQRFKSLIYTKLMFAPIKVEPPCKRKKKVSMSPCASPLLAVKKLQKHCWCMLVMLVIFLLNLNPSSIRNFSWILARFPPHSPS